MTKRSAFLKGILGDEGAEALEKTAQRIPTLDKVVFPYAVSSWITNIVEYEGQVPGIAKSELEFTKSEEGNYAGHLSIADFNYEFQKSTLSELVAVFGMVFDIENYKLNDQLKKIDFNQLNKNIDSLIKFKLEQFGAAPVQDLEKAAPVALARHKILDAPRPGHTTTNQGGMAKQVDPNRTMGMHPGNRNDPEEGHVRGNNFVNPQNHATYGGYLDAAAHHLTASRAAGNMAAIAPDDATKQHYLLKERQHKVLHKLHRVNAGYMWGKMNDYKPGAKYDLSDSDANQHFQDHYANHSNPLLLIGKSHPFDKKLPKGQAEDYTHHTSPSHEVWLNKKEKINYKSIRLSKTELYNTCDTCGRPEFEKNKFIGCLCLKDLVKNELQVKEDSQGFTLTFGKGWEEHEDSVSTLLSILKPKN